MFVRVAMQKRLSIARLVPLGDSQPSNDQLSWHQTLTQDISGGGISFCVNEETPAGTLLLLRLDCLKELIIPEVVLGIVRRCNIRDDAWHCGVQFVLADALLSHLDVPEIAALPSSVTDFGHHAQNRLASSIFAYQVKMRVKGLL